MRCGLVPAAVLALAAALACSGPSHAARLRESAHERALVVTESGEDAVCGDCGARRLDPKPNAVPEFVPTREWQDILPDQALPPGLYIRVNLETGKKEAKLLD